MSHSPCVRAGRHQSAAPRRRGRSGLRARPLRPRRHYRSHGPTSQSRAGELGAPPHRGPPHRGHRQCGASDRPAWRTSRQCRLRPSSPPHRRRPPACVWDGRHFRGPCRAFRIAQSGRLAALLTTALIAPSGTRRAGRIVVAEGCGEFSSHRIMRHVGREEPHRWRVARPHNQRGSAIRPTARTRWGSRSLVR